MISLLAIRLFSAVNITRNELGVPGGDLTLGSVTNILRLVFVIAGAVSVLIITIAGFKYVLSQGNPQETTKAKDTILYALVGLIVCISAATIASFVISRVSP